jgi:MOSC domain-containing protein YiiM
LEIALPAVRQAPTDRGTVELIVRRPASEEREAVDVAELTVEDGVVGDNWRTRGSRHTPDGRAEADRQVTIMSSRAITLFAGEDRTRWMEAGDQLIVDLDLSDSNLPAGTRLRIGSAVLELTGAPHPGCAKFSRRFGPDALRFANSAVGTELHLRGINARVVVSGTVLVGDVVSRQPHPRLATPG